ncbi:MAG TPA: beta-galactosidase [Chloroflexota bacterium]|nr:beta-galactosidase [Chloroflexota bacterium]
MSFSHGMSPGAHTLPRQVDAAKSAVELVSGHLNLGGRDPQGNTMSLTNYFLEWNGKPYIPVMGEFHYARFPRRYWDEALAKIKAGGIDIVATYVFWIYIEEEQGIFDWTGDRDLRAFVQLCARHDLQVMVRLGPFSHGECRNGGLPDWLYGRAIPVRSTDERFLFHVRRLYAEISARLAGLLFKDGGPVVGVQLDNEYMHAGAPWEVPFRQGTEWVPGGHEGAAYMRALKNIALEVGLDVPLYTCTGWLGSPVLENEILPMQGGYAFHPWTPDPDFQQPPTREFIFRDRHAEPLPSGTPAYEPTHYPYACCELGGGIQITYHHRPTVPPECVEAMAVVALGSGANVLGYYMYHGGSHPIGRHGYLNEFTVPRISYDFQAPIGEFGRLSESFHSLQLIHLFLHAFGDWLALMGVALPEGATRIAPEDAASVRWAARMKNNAGFLFLTNYQDHAERHDQADLQFTVALDQETLVLPRSPGLLLRANTSAILPINLKLGDIRLVYATAQPLTYLGPSHERDYVFFAPDGMRAEFAFEKSTYRELSIVNGSWDEDARRAYVTVEPGTASAITLRSAQGDMVRVSILTRPQAMRCWKYTLWGRERLLLSEATILLRENHLHLSGTDQEAISVSMFPAPSGGLLTADGAAEETQDGLFTRYTIPAPQIPIPLSMRTIDREWLAIRCPVEVLAQVKDIFLRIDYIGDIGEAYIGGILVGDNFCNGSPWEIGLKRFAEKLAMEELILHITPLRRNGGALRYLPTGMAVRAETSDEGVVSIDAISAVAEYEVIGMPAG